MMKKVMDVINGCSKRTKAPFSIARTFPSFTLIQHFVLKLQAFNPGLQKVVEYVLDDIFRNKR